MEYKQAPLPFQGQKHRFLNDFKEALKTFQDKTIFVDLFGGSGLLSHTIKQQRPDAQVIYNDYDYYTTRLEHIPQTNALISKIRRVCKGESKEKITGEKREQILEIIKKADEIGFVDYPTLSASLLFSGKYVMNYDDFSKGNFYYKVKKSDYNADGYLSGVEISHLDYRLLFSAYKDKPNVCFILDPPYLSTDCTTYQNYWRLKDYLDILSILQNSSYFYFTSDKTAILDLCEWISANTNGNNPLQDAKYKEKPSSVNYSAKYKDMMFYKTKKSS